MIVHGQGGQPRPETAAWKAAVETGDGADPGLREFSRQCAQVVWIDSHVAIAHDNDGMARELRHVDEV